jgi:hypothetical protein
MSFSRPKKNSTDQGQRSATPEAKSTPLSSTCPNRRHLSAKALTVGTTSTTGAFYLSSQMSMDYAPSHPHSSVMDIDCNMASVVPEQQLQQSGRPHSPHMHSPHYNPPHPQSRQQHTNFTRSHSQPHDHQQRQHQHHGAYLHLPPHYPSSSSSHLTPSSMVMMEQSESTSVAVFPRRTPTPRLDLHNYSSSCDDKDHNCDNGDGRSGHSVLSVDRDIADEDDGEDEIMEDDFGSYSPSSRKSQSCSPSATSFSTTSSPMEIEDAGGGNGGLSSTSSQITGRRPGMSIHHMLN